MDEVLNSLFNFYFLELAISLRKNQGGHRLQSAPLCGLLFFACFCNTQHNKARPCYKGFVHVLVPVNFRSSILTTMSF